MKRFMKLVVLIACCLFLATPVYAEISEEKTADAAITAGYGYFGGIIVVTDGTNAVTVNIYDAAAASGRKLIPETVITTSSTDRIQAIGYGPTDVYYYTGIYVDITCSGTVTYMVVYHPKQED